MKVAYADPPYPGCAHYYKDHPDYGGEVDHVALVEQLLEFDGFVLHTSSTAGLRLVLPLVPDDVRVMSWVKPFCAFKANVPVAYSWEPVFVRAARKPVVSKRLTLRDHISQSITLKKGLTGAKPPEVCRWAFEVVGARPGDELIDMFPGTGIVSETWSHWCHEVEEEEGNAKEDRPNRPARQYNLPLLEE